jgi:hypothetical protein
MGLPRALLLAITVNQRFSGCWRKAGRCEIIEFDARFSKADQLLDYNFALPERIEVIYVER